MRKNGLKKVILLVILLAVVLGIVIAVVNKNSDKGVALQTITENDVKYYILRVNNKFGVIDKEGNIVVEPKYGDLVIPNPTKDVFLYTEGNEINNKNYKAINGSGNELFGNYDVVEAIQINQLSSYVPYEKTVLKYKKNNLYGLISYTGEKITDAIYEEIQGIDYKEGYLKVKKSGSYGVIDITGKQIIKCEYSNIESDGYFSEKTKYSKSGFILQVKTDNGYKYGYANYKGKVVKDAMFNDISRVNEIDDDKNAYLMISMNGKYSLYKNDKDIFKSEFEDIGYDSSSKLFIVHAQNGQGIFNIQGKNIIPVDYDSISIGGEYINATKGEEKIVFDLNGNKIDAKYVSYSKVSDKYGIIIDENYNYNIVDKNLNKLLKDDYIYIEYFRNDLFIATKNANTGIIDAAGNVVVPIKYGTITKINGTDILAATLLKNNEIDLINAKGSVINGLENAVLENNDNYIKIYSKTNVKYYDKEGNEVSYKKLFPNNKVYADSKNGKWGFVDSNGNVIVDYKYEMVTEQFGNFVGIKENGKWGVLTVTGTNVIKPTYKLNNENVRFLSQYYEVKNNLGVSIFTGDLKE